MHPFMVFDIVLTLGIVVFMVYIGRQTRMMRMPLYLFAAGFGFVSLGHELTNLAHTAGLLTTQQTMFVMSGEILAGGLLVAAALWVNTNNVIKDYTALDRSVTKISKGDFEQTLPDRLLERDDELGDISRSFNRLLVSLEIAAEKTDSGLATVIEESGVSQPNSSKRPR